MTMIEPVLAAQWHPTRNGDPEPHDLTAGSNREVWWVCPLGHQWRATVNNRTSGTGCPVCVGRQVLVGFNDLATTHPDVAVQWHAIRNGDLEPRSLTAGSNRKVWWVCPAGHQWQAVVSSRTSGTGCPVCSGNQVLVGFNDLATTHPDVAAQWHPSLNGDLRPRDLTAGSKRRVWWVCSLGHHWQTRIYHRAGPAGAGCPVCSGRQVLVGFNDLATTHPDVAAQWHPSLNGDMGPCDTTAGSDRRVWWVCSFGHPWQAAVVGRARGNGCPVCAGKQVLVGFNDLVTTHPDIADQWHLTRNGDLEPHDVTAGSDRKVWWVCSLGHPWQAAVVGRAGGNGCPVCAGKQVLVGFNDLATTHPDVADQWHPVLNGDLGPHDVSAGSGREVWWVCSLGHQWQTKICSKVRGGSCPMCSGRQVLIGFNDLATTNPDVAAQWSPTLNGDLRPCDVSAGTNRRVWWVCQVGHRWNAKVNCRTQGTGCPVCARAQTSVAYGDLATTHPDLADQWHPTRNRDLEPHDVTAGSNCKVWWACSLGHPWQARVAARARGTGCPVCSGRQALAGFNDLATTHPDVAAQWHPVLNGDLGPSDVSAGLSRKVWWLCPLGHPWQTTVGTRVRASGCAVCTGRQVLVGFNDLATTHPDVAAQWHSALNGDLGPHDVTAGSNHRAWWACQAGHQWQAKVGRRTRSRRCPECTRQQRKTRSG